MSTSQRKIAFKDKEDLLNINDDSKYVLTAANINQIKYVINNLADQIANRLTYAQLFRYIRFNVPNNLNIGDFYSLKLQLSKNKDFSQSIQISCFPNLTLGQETYNPSQNGKFSIFKDETWKSYSDLVFLSQDNETEVQIDINQYISDVVKTSDIPFFGRYKLVNLTKSTESNWFGFTLGFSNYKETSYFQNDVTGIKITGKTQVSGKSTNNYNVIATLKNNTQINVTQNTKLQLVGQSTASLSGSILTVPNVIDQETCVLKATYVSNGVNFITYFSVFIKPFQLVQLYIDGPNSISDGESKQYYVKAKCKDGTLIDFTNESTFSIQSKNCTIEKQNGKLILKCVAFPYDDQVCILNAFYTDDDTGLKFFASKSLYVNKVFYNNFKINFSFQNQSEKVMETYDTNSLFTIGKINNSTFSSIKFNVLLLSDSLLQLEKTSDVRVYQIGTSYFNIEDLDDGKKKISLLNTNGINGQTNAVLLFTYTETNSGKSIIKPYSIKIIADGSTSTTFNGSIQIRCSKYILNDDDTLNYEVYNVASDSTQTDITDSCDVEVVSSISGFTIDKDEHSISTSTLSETATALLKVTYNNNSQYEEIFFVKE